MKGSYLHHKSVRAAQGIKIAAPGLESAVAGTQMLVVQPGDDLEALKEEVMADMQDIFSSVARGGAHLRERERGRVTAVSSRPYAPGSRLECRQGISNSAHHFWLGRLKLSPFPFSDRRCYFVCARQ